MEEQEEKYGIDIDNAHPKAIELIPEEFFWSCIDELAPFGSDEGDTALAEYRDWRKANPNTPTLECLKWVIESVGEMNFADYNQKIVDKKLIKSQLEDDDFDDQQYIYTLDNSVIATGLAQLVDEGIIEQQNKSIIQLAIDRQKNWAELSEGWEHSKEYIDNLQVLERALNQA
ncbi:hypothetical protein HB364_23705 [Pseudoflavitalea sp. X16]|uniref:hypothetical protein n=1 Tax=Paraflavitalea devenefica TaxID=2716334 RepID=UPI00141DD03B|nr:hypothetical protein [Paraflavitalea devenefica]NII28109.1 hypothetical protein [Paraflavitalea devenefica]